MYLGMDWVEALEIFRWIGKTLDSKRCKTYDLKQETLSLADHRTWFQSRESVIAISRFLPSLNLRLCARLLSTNRV